MKATNKILIITLSLLLGFIVIMAVLMKINTVVLLPIAGSGNVVVKELQVEDFNALTIDGNPKVTILQGDSVSLTIKADDNLYDIYEIIEKNNKLSFHQFRSISKGSTLELHFTVVDLKSLKVSRGSRVFSSGGLSLDSIDLEVSSGANVNLTMDSKWTRVNASSGSQASISGSTLDLEVKTSSGASVCGSDLEAQNVSVKTSSGASNKVWATSTLMVEASSGSSVIYSGNPSTKVERTSSGASIRSRN